MKIKNKRFKVKYCELLKDLKSAEQFCKLNNIKPEEVIITWIE